MSIKLPIRLEEINLKSFVDMPATLPALGIPLQRVGISNRPHYIRVLDPFDGSTRELLADISLNFALPADRRGIHMSRIEESLLQLRNEETLSLRQYTEKLFGRISDLQKLPAASVSIICNYEKIVGKNSSGKISSELLTLHSSITKSEKNIQPEIGVTVPFMNACPCTQRWGVRDFYNTLKERDYADEEMRFLLEAAPKQAHTNRGTATVKISSEAVDVGEIYDVLDRSLPIVRELLKGMDEHDFVKKAHAAGMFCEDNIRTVIAELVTSFKDRLSPQTRLSVKIDVDESVHHHNLSAEVTDSMENLRMSFKGSNVSNS
jgi:GTP cyclohydrolase FolE2